MRFYFRALATVLFFSTGSSFVFAQAPTSGKVTGSITDAGNKGMGYVTVTLLKQDSSVVNGDLTKDDGSFSIAPTGIGNFILRISGIGAATKYINNINISADALEKNLGTIKAGSTTQQLKGVTVTGEKAAFEMNIDKKTFNVDKNITATGGSATDVLQNIPSVSVDVDGSVSLRGKSSIILIDGKPATLFGGDVTSALQSLPSASIQSVEVITNPSSKYDAQGMAGIINIITKRDKKFGFNGSVTVGAGTRDKYNGSLNLNIKNEKWNIFFNSSARFNRNYNRTTNERSNTGTDDFFSSYDDNIRKFNGFFNSIGAEYIINKKNSVTLTQNLNRMQWGGNGVSNYKVYSGAAIDSTQRRSSYSVGGPLSSSTSLDYKHKFAKEKQELTANATYAKTWVERNQEYETYILNGDGTQRNRTVYQKAPGSGSNASLNAQVDFTTPLNKKDKLDAGLKTQIVEFESRNTPTIDSGFGAKTDFTLLNIFEYNQQTHAAYTNYGGQRGNWGYQAGLRLEYFSYNGSTQTLMGKSYTTEFLNLFPTAYVSYKLPKDQNIFLSYSRRTNRPHFMQLMPYIDLSNPQDTNMGNPNLKPEFINNMELNYSKSFKKGHNLTASAYYQYTESMIERYRKFYSDGTTFTQPQNLNTGITYGLEMIGKAQLIPIWDATLSFNFFQNEVRGANIDPVLNNSGFSWFSKLNTNLKLPEGFSLQINGNYEAPKVAAQGTLQEVYWLDIAVRKNLLKNKATLVVNVSDIFNTRKYTTTFDYPSYNQTTYRDRETRIGNISFTYRFGSSENGNKEPRGMNGNSRRGNKEQKNQQTKERENLKTDEGSGGGEGGQSVPAPSGS